MLASCLPRPSTLSRLTDEAEFESTKRAELARAASDDLLGDEVQVLTEIAQKGGPRPTDYERLTCTIQAVHRKLFVIEDGVANKAATSRALELFFADHSDAFRSTATMQGYAFLKPHGYAGDFEMIERIYNRAMCGLPHLANWERYFHASAAANAVRNRGSILSDLVARFGPRNLLSVGAGPALDIAAAVTKNECVRRVVLVDNDANAIARAKTNLTARTGDLPSVELYNRNALRLRPRDKFDLIWSAGLFDYFSNKAFVFALSRLRDALASGGAVVLGNFSHDNSSRAYMEAVGEWYLTHRSAAELLELGHAAGFPRARLEVFADETGTNLFLIAHSAQG